VRVTKNLRELAKQEPAASRRSTSSVRGDSQLSAD
jgi:hypothetical protein